MPKRLSAYSRKRIISLTKQGKSAVEVVAILREEGVATTAKTVRKWSHRWNSSLGLEDHHRSGRKSRITGEISFFVEEQLIKDDEISSRELAYLVHKQFDTKVSPSALRIHMRNKLQWTVVKTRFGPMISEKNKEKRVLFAQDCVAKGDTFDDVIWTDESTVQLTRHAQNMRVKVGKERILKPAAKHAVKVNVWAGISKRGATKICIFDTIMDSDLYIDILRHHLVPFLETFEEGYRFMQDNDPKHTSRKSREFYESEGINWWKTPASSADLNPIERVWHEMKHYLARYVKPLNKSELVKGIQQFWRQRMTKSRCQRYIQHVHVVLPKIIEKKGGITGE
jgi:transposase